MEKRFRLAGDHVRREHASGGGSSLSHPSEGAGRHHRGEQHTAGGLGEKLQQPMLFLVPVEGEGKSGEDFEEEFRAKLVDLAEEYAPLLARVKSRWLSFALVIQQECSGDEKAVRVRAV